jgi:hypothetical protein
MSEENVGTTEVVENDKTPVVRKRYDVSPEVFVKTWQESESAGEVAKKLGMPKNIVLARSAVYRKPRKDGSPGIPLKKMERKNPRKLDVQALTQLVNGGSEA